MDDLETVKSAIADKIAALPEKSLLLMDDDAPFRNRLGRALEARGFTVAMAENVAQALDYT